MANFSLESDGLFTVEQGEVSTQDPFHVLEKDALPSPSVILDPKYSNISDYDLEIHLFHKKRLLSSYGFPHSKEI